MMWDHWINLYIRTHGTARCLAVKTLASYEATLGQFRGYVRDRLGDLLPSEIKTRHVLEYLEYRRRERDNGASAICGHVVVLRNFYRAMVAMEQIEPGANPMAGFPKIKGAPKKLPVVLSAEEVERLLAEPDTSTRIGLRDRAILVLLYDTGIRATECAELLDSRANLEGGLVTVRGKGGHERTLHLSAVAVTALVAYRQQRGPELSLKGPFFRGRHGAGVTRGTIYERVRCYCRRARFQKHVTPHTLRHTCATHMVQMGANLIALRDKLGHRQITSTQLYVHLTGEDLREAAKCHPINRLAPLVYALLPVGRQAPFQHRRVARRRACG
jgi:integrase/recombinase XerD